MSDRSFLACCVCLLVLSCSLNHACGQNRLAEPEVVVFRTADLRFEPRQAWLFIEFADGEASRLRAVTVPLGIFDDQHQTRRWAIGALLKVPSGKRSLIHSLLISGEKNVHAFLPPQGASIEDLQGNTLSSIEDLRQQLAAKSAILKSWRTQIGAQEESLRRLQADADLIGDIGRIVDVQDEIQRIESEYENLGKDIDNLKNFFALAKNYPEPKNIVRRELELSTQLAELAAAARKVEASETLRRTEASLDTQRKLEMIEATRFDNQDQLQKQLVDLRRRRMELEKRYGSVDQLPPAEVAPEGFDVNAPL